MEWIWNPHYEEVIVYISILKHLVWLTELAQLLNAGSFFLYLFGFLDRLTMVCQFTWRAEYWTTSSSCPPSAWMGWDSSCVSSSSTPCHSPKRPKHGPKLTLVLSFPYFTLSGMSESSMTWLDITSSLLVYFLCRSHDILSGLNHSPVFL